MAELFRVLAYAVATTICLILTGGLAMLISLFVKDAWRDFKGRSV